MTNPRFIENIFINRGGENNEIIKLTESAEEKLKNTQKFFRYIKNTLDSKVVSKG